MSTDFKVTKNLIETLADGRKGFAKAAAALESGDAPELATAFRGYEQQRAMFAAELESIASRYGDVVDEDGSFIASLHRGWLTVVDTLSGSSASQILKAAETGESHAVQAYEEALQSDISDELRVVVTRQYTDVLRARDQIALSEPTPV